MPRRERHNCHESCRDELFSDGQRRNGLETAPLRGVSEAPGGAMSPVPNVSAAAAVKTELLVSVSAVRARVSDVCALVTSMKVATPRR
jgi:hypothetical protein